MAQDQPDAAPAPTWTVAFDGVLFATFDRQTGLRGDTAFVSQNWAMAMAAGPLGSGALTVTGMASAEPLTVGRSGYPEVFQEGETYRGLQMTDRQHPHDLIMQLSAAWRIPFGRRAALTVAGGPVGEAALGPVAFMHRPSASENPTAPLSHHIFDSTHIVTGVVLARADFGRVAIEGSMFHGREPDENRYDIEIGPLDSWSTRLWFRPGAEWTFEASRGVLHEPEQLEPGDQRRTNVSASWLRTRGSGFTAVTAAFGATERTYSTVHALLAEATHQIGRTALYGRAEHLTVEKEILLIPQVVHRPHPGELVDPITAVTAGLVRDVASVGGFTIGLGADASVFRVPELLQFTHGEHPRSFHVFARLRLPARGGRMWNMTMGGPMEMGDAAHHQHRP